MYSIIGEIVVLNKSQSPSLYDGFLSRVIHYIKANRLVILSENREDGDEDFVYDSADDGRVKIPVVRYISLLLYNTNELELERKEIDRDNLQTFIHQSLGGLYPMYKTL